jgi:DNA-binding transcriptional ArsR family regulator
LPPSEVTAPNEPPAETLPRREITVEELKALAHPLRQRILYHLASVGSANATSIAAAFAESTGSTSYHLRQLERFGFVEENVEQRTGRERWWRLVPLDIRGLAEGEPATAEARETGERLGRMRLERDRELVDRYLANRHRMSEWEDAAMFSSSIARLTRDELERFTEEYVDLLKRYWRSPDEIPAEAEAVSVLMYAFPWPGEPGSR